MHDVLWAAFRSELAPWAELDYQQEISGERLRRTLERGDGASRPSLVIVSNPVAFDRAGLAEPFEAPSADRFPVDWIDAAGRWAPLYVQPIVAIYNAHHVAPPRQWADLAAQVHRSRVVFDDPVRMLTTGPALAELESALGEPGWRAFIGDLAANEPRLVADNERAVLEVATGACRLGLSNWNVARRVRPGSPVRHVFLSPTPCIPGFGLLLRGGAGPALARAFLAWLTSEGGQRAYARTGRIPAMPDVDAQLSLSAILSKGAQPLFGSADWLTEPDRWADRYRALGLAGAERPAEGKLRAPG